MTSSTSPAVTLEDKDLSAIYVSSDLVSGRGQRRTKMSVRTELLGFIVASIAGIADYRVGAAHLDILAAISAVAFAASLVSSAFRAWMKPERDWYAGRAAAESVKTMGWRYAVGGDPFPVPDLNNDASQRYLARLEQILHELPETDLSPTPLNHREITQAMNDVRGSDLHVRRQVYKRDRIEDQLGWYQRRMLTHGRSARSWLGVTIASSALGLVAAAVKFFGAIDFDMLGVFASVASAAIAWNQLNQHRTLAYAYGLAARELSIIRDRIDRVPDDRWRGFVSDSEDAISREHAMWLARHGHPVPPAR
jgi:SMODS and SLOG-associating 2TM effector domain 3/SMODS and SLOG-associating 2TM effector domain 1